jgi:hypothetical protein
VPQSAVNTVRRWAYYKFGGIVLGGFSLATPRLRDELLAVFGGRPVIAMLARRPQPVSLAGDRIPGDCTDKFLRDVAGRLAGDPEAPGPFTLGAAG